MTSPRLYSGKLLGQNVKLGLSDPLKHTLFPFCLCVFRISIYHIYCQSAIFEVWLDEYNVSEYISLINVDSELHYVSCSAHSPYRDKIRTCSNSRIWSYVLYFRTSDKRRNLAKQKAEAQRRLYGQNSIKRLLPGSSDWEQQRHQLERRKEELV